LVFVDPFAPPRQLATLASLRYRGGKSLTAG
jgi:hypothetical protein